MALIRVSCENELAMPPSFYPCRFFLYSSSYFLVMVYIPEPGHLLKTKWVGRFSSAKLPLSLSAQMMGIYRFVIFHWLLFVKYTKYISLGIGDKCFRCFLLVVFSSLKIRYTHLMCIDRVNDCRMFCSRGHIISSTAISHTDSGTKSLSIDMYNYMFPKKNVIERPNDTAPLTALVNDLSLNDLLRQGGGGVEPLR